MITDIQFTEEFTAPLGLQPATLRDLKSLVVLAGPNGAGKSRYLELVKKVSDIKTIPLTYNLNIDFNMGFDGEFGRHPLKDPPEAVDKTVASNTVGGFGLALESVYSYFFDVARALHEAEHPRLRGLKHVVQAHADAEAFNKVLRALLNVEIEPALNENRRVIAEVRGRPFDPDELSKGELVLAVWAILLHRQKEWLKGARILIDEPENHLHPDVCIRAISALQKDIIGPKGQIWIATHSIPLIAHAGMDSVYFVDNGTIEYAGNQIEKVIDRLMGGPEGRTKLRTFLSDAEGIAFDVFAAQCLLPPAVAPAKEKDPQQAQLVNIATTTGADNKTLRILDFAAGRGRLAAALHQAGFEAERAFTYYAYNDPRFSKDEELQECLQHIRQLEQPGRAEDYLVDRLDQLTGVGSEPMDLVVMCNVLHEIPVEHWQRRFYDIREVLAPSGRLVILEDQFPNVGELPHENGYIILDELALRELFQSPRGDVMALHEKPEARLTAFSITRSALQRISSESIVKALNKVMRRAREEILRIRSIPTNERTYQLGRKHAHFTLLYANAQLAQELYASK